MPRRLRCRGPSPRRKHRPKLYENECRASIRQLDQQAQRAFLEKVLKQIRHVANDARASVEAILGKVDTLIGDDLDYALDEIQEAAEQSDDFLADAAAAHAYVESRQAFGRVVMTP